MASIFDKHAGQEFDLRVADRVAAKFLDPFRRGVREMSSAPVVFLSKDAFPGPLSGKASTPEDISRLKTMLEGQYPGMTKDATDKEISDFLRDIKNHFAAAGADNFNGERICLAIEPLQKDKSLEVISTRLSGLSSEELGALPVTAKEMLYAIGLHEGQHCNQDVPKNPSPMQTLALEIDADQHAVDTLRQKGLSHVADVFMDYRALRANAASTDVEHATGPFVDSDHSKIPDRKDMEAADMSVRAMDELAGHVLGIKPKGVEDLFKKDPRSYFDAVKLGLIEFGIGSYGHETDSMKYKAGRYIEDFVVAYERQVLGARPAGQSTRMAMSDFLRNSNDIFSPLVPEREAYIAGVSILEKIRVGERLDSAEEKDLRRIFRGPEKDTEVVSALMARYGDAMVGPYLSQDDFSGQAATVGANNRTPVSSSPPL